MKKALVSVALLAAALSLPAQTRLLCGEDFSVAFTDGIDTLRTPAEGLWSVAT